MMPEDELPSIIEGMRSWLIEQGFYEQERRYYPTVFGNWLIVLARGRCRVQIVRDRSQWLIEISGDGLADWYDTDLWRACLEDGEAPLRPITVEDATAFIRTGLTEIDAALRSPDALDRCLRQKGRERYERSKALRARNPGEAVPPPADES